MKTDAETWADLKNIEVQNQGVEHCLFSPDLRRQAEVAGNLLLPHGVSLLDAVKIALPLIESRKNSLPVAEALPLFFDDYEVHGGPKVAVASDSYLKFLREKLAPFSKTYGERLVADIAVSEVEAFLASRRGAGAVTRQGYVRAISAFYTWAVKKGFRLDNPLSKIRKRLSAGSVSIISVLDARKLLAFAAEDEIGVLTLAMFCGIRIAEFGKLVRNDRRHTHFVSLDWQDIDLKRKQAFVRPELDKNRHGRYVDIPTNAIAWLRRSRLSGGAVMPENWRNRRHDLQERSGVVLPQNVLRHSFCSYRIALDQDYARAAAMVGNSPAMLRKHYVRVLPKHVGRAYFQIKPQDE